MLFHGKGFFFSAAYLHTVKWEDFRLSDSAYGASPCTPKPFSCTPNNYRFNPNQKYETDFEIRFINFHSFFMKRISESVSEKYETDSEIRFTKKN